MATPKKSTKPTDKERLDWLKNAHQTLEVSRIGKLKRWFFWKWQHDSNDISYPSPRAAIDAAVAAERRDKKKARG